MLIEEHDFRLTPVTESSSKYDIELLYTVNKGKANERTEFRNAGYGLSLENALRKVCISRMENKYGDGSISLKEFLKGYKEEVKKITKLCEI